MCQRTQWPLLYLKKVPRYREKKGLLLKNRMGNQMEKIVKGQPKMSVESPLGQVFHLLKATINNP